MAKLNKRLQDMRDPVIVEMYADGTTAEDIGLIFNLSTSAVWEIVRREKERTTNSTV